MENQIETNRDYENIDRPYDSNLNRSDSGNDNGSVMNQPVKSDGDFGDVWIKNFIRSENWHPKKVGFYINGQTGYAEFMNVFISGDIQALTGTIGGFVIGDHTISSDDLVLTSKTTTTVASIKIGSDEGKQTYLSGGDILMYDNSSPGFYDQAAIRWLRRDGGDGNLIMQKRSGNTGNDSGNQFEMFFLAPPDGYYNIISLGASNFGSGNENTGRISAVINNKTADPVSVNNGLFDVQIYENGTFLGRGLSVGDARLWGGTDGASAYLEAFGGGAAGLIYENHRCIYQDNIDYVTLAGHLYPISNNSKLIGTDSLRFSQIFGIQINAKYFTTSNSVDYISIADSTASGYSTTAIMFVDSGTLIGSIEPMFNVTGNGARYLSYDQSLNEKGAIEIVYNPSSGISEINLDPEGIAHDGLNLTYLDGDTFVLADFEGTRIDSPFSPLPGTPSTSDLGRSDAMWDDLWIDEVHYNTLTPISDRILKKNIKDISWGLKDVLKLRPVEFDWKRDNTHNAGFIAQEVQEHIPSLVTEVIQKEVYKEKVHKQRSIIKNNKTITEDYVEKVKKIERNKVYLPGMDPKGQGLLQINMTPIVPMLVKAIQELNEKVEKLLKK